MIALVVILALAAQEDESQGMSLLMRPEPALQEGVELLAGDDVDRAIESFRRAEADAPAEKAAVEYDVGQALLKKALAAKKAAPQGEEKLPDDVKRGFDDARAAFDRAYGEAPTQQQKSEAALAAGNALAEAGDVKGAIESYRRSVVADPANQNARDNLLRALRYLRAQPPPPPQDGDDQKDDDKKDDEKKDGDQQQKKDGDDKKDDQQKKDDEKKDGEQQQGNEKKDDDKKDQQQQKPGDEKKDGEQKPQAGQQGDEKPPDEKGGQQPQTAEQKARAKRLLDALRTREKAMQPMNLRAQPGKLTAPEKDW